MNRCIACYRCVRFYRDYAGGTDFGVFSIRNQVYFGRQQDGVLESEFSGNLVEVCPTGVFDDKTLARHYSRKWDLQTAPSVCPHCGMGCSITPHERYGELRRVLARYNPRVNGHFICDRGRYGYAFVNAAAALSGARGEGRATGGGRSAGRRAARRPPSASRRRASARATTRVLRTAGRPGRGAAPTRTSRRPRSRRSSTSLAARLATADAHRHRLAARLARVELRAAHAGRAEHFYLGLCEQRA